MPEIHLYDFDSTLFRSPHEPDVWEGDWWNDVRSLEPPCVPHQPDASWWVPETVASARKSIANPDVLAVLATGRELASGFRYRVPELLHQQGLRFDEVHLAPPSGTIAWKQKLLGDLIRRHRIVDTVRIWEDRRSHIPALLRAAVSAGIDPERVHVTEVRVRSKEPECDGSVAEVRPQEDFSYVGVFLTSDSRATLAHRFPYAFNRAEGGHVTLSRNPLPELLARVGEPVVLHVVGIAQDDKVQAAVVRLPPGLSSDNLVPHVTISHAEGVAPKDSNRMLAEVVPTPVPEVVLR